jgi:hypothetical protein
MNTARSMARQAGFSRSAYRLLFFPVSDYQFLFIKFGLEERYPAYGEASL